MEIGLEIRPLAPLVPGIDADQRLAKERFRLSFDDEVVQPRLIFCGRRAGYDQAITLAPGVIVPARHGRAD